MLYRFAEKVDPFLKVVYRALFGPPVPNLRGDRDVEYTFISANMPQGPGEALDFGCGNSHMGLLAARKGFNVTAIDLTPAGWLYSHPNLRFVQRDVFEMAFGRDCFDLIVNCSSVEHVGLQGRYSVLRPRPDGDIEAMAVLRNVLKPGGKMLLTIPVGRDRVFNPLHRVYGTERLRKLLDNYQIVTKEFWIKDNLNKWVFTEEFVALNKEPLVHCYGLGLFVLRKPA